MFWSHHWSQQRLPTVPVSDIPATILYAFLATLGATTSFIGFALAPAAAGQCSNSTSNLFSGIIIFPLCGQENLSLQKLFTVVLCIFGVILVVQPWHEVSDQNLMGIYKGDNHSVECFLLPDKLCALKENCCSIVNLTTCINHYQVGSGTTNLCKILHKYCAAATVDKELSFKCSEWLSCCLLMQETQHNSVIIHGHNNKGKNFELFQVRISEKYCTWMGYFFTAMAGTCCTLYTAVQKQYPCIGEDKMRSLFWSFSFGYVSSLVLTFVVETPVWPQSLFDVLAVFLHTLATLGMWISWIWSLQYISGTLVNVIHCTTVAFMLIPQYTVLASVLPGQRNWMEAAGVFIVMSGSVLASLLEMFGTSGNIKQWQKDRQNLRLQITKQWSIKIS